MFYEIVVKGMTTVPRKVILLLCGYFREVLDIV